MITQLDWLVDRRVLYAARSGKESLADLEAFARRLDHCLAEEGQVPVHLIWDMSGLEVEHVDRRKAMTFLSSIMKHEMVRWFVVVDPGMPFLRRLLAKAMMPLSGIHWHRVDSKAAGLAFLRAKDPSLWS